MLGRCFGGNGRGVKGALRFRAGGNWPPRRARGWADKDVFCLSEKGGSDKKCVCVCRCARVRVHVGFSHKRSCARSPQPIGEAVTAAIAAGAVWRDVVAMIAAAVAIALWAGDGGRQLSASTLSAARRRRRRGSRLCCAPPDAADAAAHWRLLLLLS